MPQPGRVEEGVPLEGQPGVSASRHDGGGGICVGMRAALATAGGDIQGIDQISR